MMAKRHEKDLKLWELAGLMDQDGRGLYRPLASSAVIVPTSVELENKGLRWQVVYPLRYKPTGKGLLEDFVKLGDVSAEAIRDYARRWGVLEICKHGYPRSHNSATWPRSWALPASCEPLEFHYGQTKSGGHYEKGWEPIERWWHFAQQARAILNIAAKLNSQSTHVSEGWTLLYQEYEEEFHKPLRPENSEDIRRLLSFAVNDWLQLGGVRPQFVWKEPAPKLEVGGPTLFGHLAVQLALVVSRTEAMVFCSRCGIPYLPSRQPNRNRRNFCDTCRDNKIPERLASREYRARLNRSPKKSSALVKSCLRTGPTSP